MQEMQVRSLGQEDPLEKETATYSKKLINNKVGQQEVVDFPDGSVVKNLPAEQETQV